MRKLTAIAILILATAVAANAAVTDVYLYELGEAQSGVNGANAVKPTSSATPNTYISSFVGTPTYTTNVSAVAYNSFGSTVGYSHTKAGFYNTANAMPGTATDIVEPAGVDYSYNFGAEMYVKPDNTKNGWVWTLGDSGLGFMTYAGGVRVARNGSTAIASKGITNNTWHHLAFTSEYTWTGATTSTASWLTKAYIDGKLAGTYTGDPGRTSGSSHFAVTTGGGSWFNGSTDNIRVFTYDTAGEVGYNELTYAQKSQTTAPGLVNGTFDDSTGSMASNWQTELAGAQSGFEVSSGQIHFNGDNQPVGTKVYQTIATYQTKVYTAGSAVRRHVTGASTVGVRMDVFDGDGVTSGTAINSQQINTTSGTYQTSTMLLQATGSTATMLLTDTGTTNSADVWMDNVTFTAAQGYMNIAPTATATAKDHYTGFGDDPQWAIDGSTNYGGATTTYHSLTTANAWWEMTFAHTTGERITSIEIQARSGFNDRNGNLIELFDFEGNLIDSAALPDQALVTLDALIEIGEDTWDNIYRIRISNDASEAQQLNIAEVRTFAYLFNGETVPEPATMSLLALGGMAMLRRKKK